MISVSQLSSDNIKSQNIYGNNVYLSNTSGYTVIYFSNTYGSEKKWEVRATHEGAFDITNRTGTITPFQIDSNSNVGINGLSAGGGSRVVYIGNATVVPTTNPSDGGLLYVEAGVGLCFRSSAGVVTTIAPL